MSLANTGKTSTAAVYLTHRWDPVHAYRFQRLSREIAGIMDVFLLVQTRNANQTLHEIRRLLGGALTSQVRTFDPDVLPAQLGYPYLTSKGLVPGNAHYPLSLFCRTHVYEHYWLVENDVEFTGNWSVLFETCSKCNSDLIAAHLRNYQDDPVWRLWTTLVAPLRRPLNLQKLSKAFFPIYRISRSALLLINQLQRSGWRGHFECLIPTMLSLHSMSVTDFQDIHPFYLGRLQDPPKTQAEALALSTLRWRPEITLQEAHQHLDKNIILHPIKQNWSLNKDGTDIQTDFLSELVSNT